MLCRVVLIIFAVMYAVALGLFLTGIYGWFGQEQDPLSGVFLLPLGLPWVLIEVPEPLRLILGVGAPLINLAVLWVVCRLVRKKSRASPHN
jgi:hypothetical protein